MTVTQVAVIVIIALALVFFLLVVWALCAMRGQLDDADGTRG